MSLKSVHWAIVQMKQDIELILLPQQSRSRTRQKPVISNLFDHICGLVSYE